MTRRRRRGRCRAPPSAKVPSAVKPPPRSYANLAEIMRKPRRDLEVPSAAAPPPTCRAEGLRGPRRLRRRPTPARARASCWQGSGKVQGRFREGSGKVQGQPKPTGKVVVDGETWLLGGHAWLGKRGRRFWGDVGDKPSDGVLSRWLPAEGDDFALWRMDHEDGDGEDLEAYEVWHAMEAEITMDIVSRRVLLRTAGTFRRCAPRCTRWRPTCRCKIAVDF